MQSFLAGDTRALHLVAKLISHDASGACLLNYQQCLQNNVFYPYVTFHYVTLKAKINHEQKNAVWWLIHNWLKGLWRWRIPASVWTSLLLKWQKHQLTSETNSSYHVWLRGSQFSLPTFSMQNFWGPLLPLWINDKQYHIYRLRLHGHGAPLMHIFIVHTHQIREAAHWQPTGSCDKLQQPHSLLVVHFLDKLSADHRVWNYPETILQSYHNYVSTVRSVINSSLGDSWWRTGQRRPFTCQNHTICLLLRA